VTGSDSLGCNGKDSVHVKIDQLPPIFNFGNDTILCQGNSLLLDAGPGFISYHWQDGSSQQTFIVTNPGIYSVTVTDVNSCQASDSVNVNFQAIPFVDLGTGGDLCDPKEVILSAATGPAFDHYIWQDGSVLSSYLVTTEGMYSVTVSNACGSATDSVQYTACPVCSCDLPNTFSPNDDGNNDILYIVGHGFTNVELIIYDRHGEKVFETNDPLKGWDGYYKGKIQENEVYYFYLKAYCPDGQTIKKKGDITLLN
jgi:gliding motility-associated-like protein